MKNIQWFPGHMAKTRRMMKECLPEVDIVLELLDARIPYSSKNPEIDTLLSGKPSVTVLTKASLANPEASRRWIEYYKGIGRSAVLVDSADGFGIKELSATIKAVLSEKLARWAERGMSSRRIKAMIVGIPNVGKSSLINRLCGNKRAAVEDRPGVTVNKQWVTTDIGLNLLDMPGVLWPSFEDERVGLMLAATGAIRDKILDTDEVAMALCATLYERERDAFLSRYKLSEDECDGLDGYDLFMLVGVRRGLLRSGGEVDEARTSAMLLDEFRGAKIGKITLEVPSEVI
ncbi:MAG: ribosome biogenesis GTPase YlqF [Clostridia bacterium]|nr:ribosome biogenesis GTPase YlqF [Clostridia bacterium]